MPLTESYQKGWKRLFVLSPEVKKSDEAEFYQQILNAINQVQYHYDASFKKPKRKGHWHRYWFDELPKLTMISSRDWQVNKDQLSDEQRACFKLVKFWDERTYRWSYYYKFIMPELFKISIVPHIIDTITIGDALLEQRLGWIDNHIENNNLYWKLRKLQNGNRYKG
ncbi:hypothetical protein SNE25_04775 [Mucilaginibacter sabulilitoris]|uniref:Transposase n=1 Tax=Mucilaginibacter sabulilitoris TaxID=1173583 RepID=A0ABZ0TTR1_9SPHI|nr:hypothetical protein [Mucilaginibacter sabulilitoris]WPU94835.1 hypothetical protein SNE25_04775 [Mucilaginibacter sabulilitoris]